MDFERLAARLGAFGREHVEYTLVGGVAFNLHGIIRATEDAHFFIVDLLSRVGEALRYEGLESQVIDVAGARVRTATPRTLSRMNKGTLRPIDYADAAILKDKCRLEND